MTDNKINVKCAPTPTHPSPPPFGNFLDPTLQNIEYIDMGLIQIDTKSNT